MTLLDKDVMYYFRDELEKNAIIPPGLAKGVTSMVSRASSGAKSAVNSVKSNKYINNMITRGIGRSAVGLGKGAFYGTKGLNTAITRGFEAGGMGPKMSKVTGAVTTAGVIGTGATGAKKAVNKFKENKQQLRQYGPVRQAGVQQL